MFSSLSRRFTLLALLTTMVLVIPQGSALDVGRIDPRLRTHDIPGGSVDPYLEKVLEGDHEERMRVLVRFSGWPIEDDIGFAREIGMDHLCTMKVLPVAWLEGTEEQIRTLSNYRRTEWMEYDGDLHIPKKFLVAPPAIDRTLGEYLVASGVSQMAISETQKFGHVTYFFNGNRSGKFDEKLEDYIEIPSDRVPFEQRPWMKAAEITDRVAKAVRDNAYRFIRLNYANGDMVGHTGVFQAVEIAVESVDLCIGRVLEAVAEARGILVVSADHGNADDMFERKPGSSEVVLDPKTGQPKAKTSHSLNPVPVYIYDPVDMSRWRLSDRKGLGIASLAATCLVLLGFQPPEDYEPSVVNLAT